MALYRRIGIGHTAPPRLNRDSRECDRCSDVFPAKLVDQHHAAGKLIEALHYDRPDREVNDRWLIVWAGNNEREENPVGLVPFK